ncbi:MAG: DNA polymerase III subunit delta' [Neisseriaceae bacterium]|nr:DNA polymerase III subunit delta' [Neisseriaceae bacterium]
MPLYPWQTADWQRISNEFYRLPNAWLLTGLSGIGKRAFAQSLMQTLLCSHLNEHHHACGVCSSCRFVQEGNHPDTRILKPDQLEEISKDSKTATKKLTQIKIEAVRELIHFSQLSTHQTSKNSLAQRVIIIQSGETLNTNAANALLKILEEPPVQTIFILTTAMPQRVLPTIKSRCRHFLLTPPTPEIALAWLQDQKIDNAEHEFYYNGSIPLFEIDPKLILCRENFITGLGNPTLSTMLLIAESADKQRLSLEVPTLWIIKWCHDLRLYKQTQTIRYHKTQHQNIERLSEKLDLNKLSELEDKITHIAYYGQHTLNVRLQLEALLTSYIQIFNHH